MSYPKDGHTVVRVCWHCGKQYESFIARRYCGETCRKALQNERQKRNYALRKQNDSDLHVQKVREYSRRSRESDRDAYRKRQREWAVQWRAENPEAAAALNKLNQQRYRQQIKVKADRRKSATPRRLR